MPYRYRNRAIFYFRPKLPSGAYGFSGNLKTPSLGIYSKRFVPNETKDLNDRENIEISEAIRSPRDRDFYQDHTYHDQWEQRPLDKANAKFLKQKYNYFVPDFQYTPWIWYPGDMVEVVSGEQSGQRGTILAVVPYKNEIIVQNINVKDITVPATDSRPEQVVQREHPIDAKLVKHVDPTTNDLCELRVITVRKKYEESEEATTEQQLEKRRISLLSGALLPIPSTNDTGTVETGDPLKDTPYQDAVKATYNPEEELPVIIERKLRMMEEGFLRHLKESYEFHHKLQLSNAKQMKDFQRDAQRIALNKITQKLNNQAENLDDWWFSEFAPYMNHLEEKNQVTVAETKGDEM